MDLRDARGLLADRDVDADDARVLLVQDRVDQDRGLARGAVADDQLPLTTSDRDHRVDGLQPRLERLLHGLALDDAWRLELDRTALLRLDRTLAVERIPERVDDAPDESLADRHARQEARPLHRLALLDLLPVAEERGAHVVRLEIEREPGHAVLELEHLHGEGVLEAVHAGDPVTDLQNGSDLAEARLDVEVLDPLLQDRGDLFRA